MTNEIQDDYARIIYDTTYDRCTLLERQRIDTMIRRKMQENDLKW